MWHSQILASWNFSSYLNFVPGIVENYTLERSSNSFPGLTSVLGCLENSQKLIPKSGSSPIQGTRLKNVKYKGENLSLTLTRKWILSPGLENNGTLQCISDSFPCTLTYLLFLENCWNSAPMLSFSPIQGTMSRLLLKLHVARIWECHIYAFNSVKSLTIKLAFSSKKRYLNGNILIVILHLWPKR